MTTTQDILNAWGRAYLIKKLHLEEDLIPEGTHVFFRDGVQSSGYCDTCYNSWAVVHITANGYSRTYDSGMGDLIYSLKDWSIGDPV